jgi:hypothetical protein
MMIVWIIQFWFSCKDSKHKDSCVCVCVLLSFVYTVEIKRTLKNKKVGNEKIVNYHHKFDLNIVKMP